MVSPNARTYAQGLWDECPAVGNTGIIVFPPVECSFVQWGKKKKKKIIHLKFTLSVVKESITYIFHEGLRDVS